MAIEVSLPIDADLMRSLEVEASRQQRTASHLAGEAPFDGIPRALG